jgi:hypothetical protein
MVNMPQQLMGQLFYFELAFPPKFKCFNINE